MKIKNICLLIFSFTTFFLCINNLSAQINDKEKLPTELSFNIGICSFIENHDAAFTDFHARGMNLAVDANLPLYELGNHLYFLTGAEINIASINKYDTFYGLYFIANYKINLSNNKIFLYPGLGANILFGKGERRAEISPPGLSLLLRCNYKLSDYIHVGVNITAVANIAAAIDNTILLNSTAHLTYEF